MNIPTKTDIDQIRKIGFRPVIVSCFINDYKVLFLYKAEYNLWEFPQGGIDNLETPEEALVRETKEELGISFSKKLKKNPKFVHFDRLNFPKKLHGSRELKTDEGEEITMKGKTYMFVANEVESNEIDINETQFDDYKWEDYQGAKDILEDMYHINKKGILLKVVEILNSKGLIK